MLKQILILSVIVFSLTNYSFSQKATGANYDLVYYRLEIDIDPLNMI